jgi:hypothetical protein
MAHEFMTVLHDDHSDAPKASGLSILQPLHLQFQPIAGPKGIGTEPSAIDYGRSVSLEVPDHGTTVFAARSEDKDTVRVSVPVLLHRPFNGGGEEFVGRHRVVREGRTSGEDPHAKRHECRQQPAHMPPPYFRMTSSADKRP